MKLSLSLIALTLLAAPAARAETAAGNVNIRPTDTAPVCLMRTYTAEHLRKNPKQKLSAILVQLKNNEWNENGRYASGQVIGVSQGQFYGNDQPTCEFDRKGNAKCYVECDGGSFNLLPRPDSVMMQVTKGYYFPLFKNGTSPNEDREPAPGDVLQLDGDDADNAVYRLQKVDPRACEEAIRKMRIGEFGC